MKTVVEKIYCSDRFSHEASLKQIVAVTLHHIMWQQLVLEIIHTQWFVTES